MDFASEGLLGRAGGRGARPAPAAAASASPTTGSRRSRAAQGGKPRTGWPCCPSSGCWAARYTAEEVRSGPGCRPGPWCCIRRLLGLPTPSPDDRVFSDEDVDAAQSIKLFLDAGFAEERIAEITRVLGEGMARLAATITAAFVETFLNAGRQRGGGRAALRRAGRGADPGVRPGAGGRRSPPTCATASGAAMLGRAELEAGDVTGAQDMAVCFADLVGFTRLGGQVEVRELEQRGRAAGRAGRRGDPGAGPAGQDDRRRGDVRQPRPGGAGRGGARAGRGGAEAAELPSLRAGIAFGPAAGPRRATTSATRSTWPAGSPASPGPGSVLCTQEVRDAAADAFQLVSGGPAPAQGRVGAVACTARGSSAPTPASQTPATTGPRTTGLGDGVQVDHEDERRVSRDLRLGAWFAVAEARRDDQLAPAADLHARDALLPALDHARQGQ